MTIACLYLITVSVFFRLFKFSFVYIFSLTICRQFGFVFFFLFFSFWYFFVSWNWFKFDYQHADAHLSGRLYFNTTGPVPRTVFAVISLACCVKWTLSGNKICFCGFCKRNRVETGTRKRVEIYICMYILILIIIRLLLLLLLQLLLLYTFKIRHHLHLQTYSKYNNTITYTKRFAFTSYEYMDYSAINNII